MKGNLLFASILASLLAGNLQAAPLVISDPWIRAMPESSRVIPVFFKLHNASAQDRVLVAIKSGHGKVEIHQTLASGNLMKMQPIDALPIAAGEQVMLKPGGYHGMMSQFTQGVPQEGELVPMTLVYANGEEQEVRVKVVRKVSTGMSMSSHN